MKKDFTFWAWLLSIPIFSVWWGSFVFSDQSSGNQLFDFVVALGGWFAYIRGTFWLCFESSDRNKPPSDHHV